MITMCLFFLCLLATPAAVHENNNLILTVEPEPTEVFEMDTVTMRCRCKSCNSEWFTWYKGGMERPIDYSKVNSRSTYQITSVSMSDSGVYTCRGWSYSYIESNTITLQVSERPKAVLTIEVDCSNKFEGKKVKLRCEVPGKYNDWKYVFYKNGGRYKLYGNMDVYEIGHMNRYSEYQYSCQGLLERPPSYSKLSDPIKLKAEVEAITEPILEFSQYQFWEGDLVTLHCYTQVNQWYNVSSLRYTYYKDREILKTILNESTLEFRLHRFENMSNYSCNVTNEGTECTRSSKPVALHVSELISIVILQAVPTAFVREGQPLTLACSANVLKHHFTEPLLYTFLKDGEPVTESSSSAQYTTTANESHTGEYECEGQLNTVTKRSLPVSVLVWIPVSTPVMVISGNRTTSPGDSLHISCQSSRGTDPIHYQLYFRNQQNNDIQLTEDSGPISYKLNITGEVQTGSYWCRANNSEEDEPALSNEINIMVIVPVSGASLMSNLSGTGVSKGSSIFLTCTLSAGTEPRFIWFHNDHELPSIDPAKTYALSEKGSYLTIYSVSERHEGDYYCVAVNGVGDSKTYTSSSSIVQLKIAHSSPVALIITAILITFLLVICIAFLAIRYRSYCSQWRKYVEKPKVNRQNSRLPAVPTAPPMDEWREQNNLVPAASSDDRFPIDNRPRDERLVYSMVDIKKTTGANRNESKGRTGSANADSVEYYVTYAMVNLKGSIKKNVHASEEEEGGTDDEVERQEERKMLEHVRENVYCNSENLYENF
ncbi:Fc receptor-like protein 5 isoform X2 [Polypterus senegalus]|uniref:Fc receptor-like protein 5 isoform X2 n=1 Tax=Polypterus senegalus TaxID=55291 RepID=UPI001962C186|nr:Fc receptor-like protein 5 isoform X2 [Polypterus senegalus]